MGDGRPEEREQRVAGELFHMPAVALHDRRDRRDRRELRENGVDDLGEAFRIQGRGQPAEAGEVGKQGGDEPPFLVQARQRRGRGERLGRLERAAAVAAEARALRVGPPAARAGPAEHFVNV